MTEKEGKAWRRAAIASDICIVFLLVFMFFMEVRRHQFLVTKIKAQEKGMCIDGGLLTGYEIIDCKD